MCSAPRFARACRAASVTPYDTRMTLHVFLCRRRAVTTTTGRARERRALLGRGQVLVGHRDGHDLPHPHDRRRLGRRRARHGASSSDPAPARGPTPVLRELSARGSSPRSLCVSVSVCVCDRPVFPRFVVRSCVAVMPFRSHHPRPLPALCGVRLMEPPSVFSRVRFLSRHRRVSSSAPHSASSTRASATRARSEGCS